MSAPERCGLNSLTIECEVTVSAQIMPNSNTFLVWGFGLIHIPHIQAYILCVIVCMCVCGRELQGKLLSGRIVCRDISWRVFFRHRGGDILPTNADARCDESKGCRPPRHTLARSSSSTCHEPHSARRAEIAFLPCPFTKGSGSSLSFSPAFVKLTG